MTTTKADLPAPIQRWSMKAHIDILREPVWVARKSKTGDYVLYSDHKAMMDVKSDALADCEHELDSLHKRLDEAVAILRELTTATTVKAVDIADDKARAFIAKVGGK